MGYSKKEILESRKRSLEALKHRIQSESKADNIPLYEVEKKYAPLIKFYKEEIEKMETNDNDATENEDLTKMEGKNKEIEKMPLKKSKDVILAQDSNEILKLSGFTMDDENWITMNGTHVKIEEGQSKESAAKNFIKKKGGNPAPAKSKQSKTQSKQPKTKLSSEQSKQAKYLEEESELSSPEKIKKVNGVEAPESYKNDYKAALNNPVGKEINFNGEKVTIEDYFGDDDGENIYVELSNGDTVTASELSKATATGNKQESKQQSKTKQGEKFNARQAAKEKEFSEEVKKEFSKKPKQLSESEIDSVIDKIKKSGEDDPDSIVAQAANEFMGKYSEELPKIKNTQEGKEVKGKLDNLHKKRDEFFKSKGENENMSLKEQMEFFDKTEEEFESTLSNEEKTLLWYDDRLEREEGKAQEKVRNDFKKQISKRLTRDSYEILQLSGFTIDATPYQIGDIVWVRIKGEEYKGKILRLDNNRAYIYCMPLDTTGWINISQLRGKA